MKEATEGNLSIIQSKNAICSAILNKIFLNLIMSIFYAIIKIYRGGISENERSEGVIDGAFIGLSTKVAYKIGENSKVKNKV
jgi:hypothetical protein